MAQSETTRPWLTLGRGRGDLLAPADGRHSVPRVSAKAGLGVLREVTTKSLDENTALIMDSTARDRP
jgi:hypothetical protein